MAATNPVDMELPTVCGARTRNGGTCRKAPTPGATRCRMHGGNTPKSLAKASERLARRSVYAELAQMRRLGLVEYADDQNPVEVLAEQLREAHVNVAMLRLLVGELGDDLTTTDSQSRPYVKALVDLYGQERDRLARLSEVAVKLGLAERQMRLLEAHGRRIISLIAEAMESVDMPAETRTAVRVAIADKLRSVSD